MAQLPDDMDIRKVNTPGTHDTMARFEWFFKKYVTQDLKLDEQLNLGIRYNDIRMVCHHSTIYMHHGEFYMYADLDDVFKNYT